MTGINKHIYHSVLREPISFADQPCYACIFFAFDQKVKYYLPLKDFNK